MHEDLVASHFPFFKTATSRRWRKSSDRVIRMPEDEPHVFEVYLKWLYSGLIFSKSDEGETQNHPITDEYILLYKCYILGEKLQDVGFKDTIMDSINELTWAKKGIITSTIRFVYDNTPASSPVRRFLVDVFTYSGEMVWIGKGKDSHEEFLFDVSASLLRLKHRQLPDIAPYVSSSCNYHDHIRTGELCYRMTGAT